MSDFIVRLEKFTFATKGNTRKGKHILEFSFKGKSFVFFPKIWSPFDFGFLSQSFKFQERNNLICMSIFCTFLA